MNTLSARAQGRWLQRACAAYCYITVPSLACALTRAHLYLLSGQTALLNNCIGQGINAILNLLAFVKFDVLEVLSHIPKSYSIVFSKFHFEFLKAQAGPFSLCFTRLTAINYLVKSKSSNYATSPYLSKMFVRY